jgi:hypothetical protein
MGRCAPAHHAAGGLAVPPAGRGIWAALALLAWWRAELTLEWVAGTGVAAGLILLLIGMGHEQYRDWKDTRYKDVER